MKDKITNHADAVLSWPAGKFRAAIGAALLACSTDPERRALCTVLVERVNGVLTIAATDGTWLFRWKESEGQTDENGEVLNRKPFEARIPRHVCESFLAATKKHLELERVLLNGEGHRWELSTILDVVRHEFLQVPEEFPPIDQAIPSSVAPSTAGIGVGANMLIRVSKAFALATGEPQTTEIGRAHV